MYVRKGKVDIRFLLTQYQFAPIEAIKINLFSGDL